MRISSSLFLWSANCLALFISPFHLFRLFKRMLSSTGPSTDSWRTPLITSFILKTKSLFLSFNNLLNLERHCFILQRSQRAHRKVVAVKAVQKSKSASLEENPSMTYILWVTFINTRINSSKHSERFTRHHFVFGKLIVSPSLNHIYPSIYWFWPLLCILLVYISRN